MEPERLVDPLDASLTIEYVKVSPLSISEPDNDIALAVSSSVETFTALVVGASFTFVIVKLTVPAVLVKEPSLAVH